MSTNHAGKTMDGYVHVSREGKRKGSASFYSPTDQASMIVMWASANGVTVGEIFEDRNWSGQTMDRPEFQKARSRIDNHDSDGLIVAVLARFGRNTGGMIEVERQIRDAGGVLVNLDGEFNTSTPEGEKMFATCAADATYRGRVIQRGWQRRAQTQRGRGAEPHRRRVDGWERLGADQVADSSW
jgi:DNA invertase Pin-like site-specific DNA recombinase